MYQGSVSKSSRGGDHTIIYTNQSIWDFDHMVIPKNAKRLIEDSALEISRLSPSQTKQSSTVSSTLRTPNQTAASDKTPITKEAIVEYLISPENLQKLRNEISNQGGFALKDCFDALFVQGVNGLETRILDSIAASGQKIEKHITDSSVTDKTLQDVLGSLNTLGTTLDTFMKNTNKNFKDLDTEVKAIRKEAPTKINTALNTFETKLNSIFKSVAIAAVEKYVTKSEENISTANVNGPHAKVSSITSTGVGSLSADIDAIKTNLSNVQRQIGGLDIEQVKVTAEGAGSPNSALVLSQTVRPTFDLEEPIRIIDLEETPHENERREFSNDYQPDSHADTGSIEPQQGVKRTMGEDSESSMSQKARTDVIDPDGSSSPGWVTENLNKCPKWIKNKVTALKGLDIDDAHMKRGSNPLIKSKVANKNGQKICMMSQYEKIRKFGENLFVDDKACAMCTRKKETAMEEDSEDDEFYCFYALGANMICYYKV